jgi:hypothetical protein
MILDTHHRIVKPETFAGRLQAAYSALTLSFPVDSRLWSGDLRISEVSQDAPKVTMNSFSEYWAANRQISFAAAHSTPDPSRRISDGMCRFRESYFVRGRLIIRSESVFVRNIYILPKHTALLTTLELYHKDPFDRLLAAAWLAERAKDEAWVEERRRNITGRDIHPATPQRQLAASHGFHPRLQVHEEASADSDSQSVCSG